MQYLMMRPEQIQDAVKRQVPVVICAGSVEFHGPQEPIGTDYLIAQAVIERAEKECECIVMPPLPFAPTLFWAAGPQDGEFNFDGTVLGNYVREIFKGLIMIGFRRIYVLQHHQGREALPCSTIINAAAQTLYTDFAANYYPGWGRQLKGDFPLENFDLLIRVAHIDTFSEYKEGMERCPIGHGGKGETQLVWGQYPETIDLERLNYFKENGLTFPEWLHDSHLATQEEGDFWLDFCAKGWIKEFKKPYEVLERKLDPSERDKVTVY